MQELMQEHGRDLCNNRYYYRIGTPTLQSINSSGGSNTKAEPAQARWGWPW